MSSNNNPYAPPETPAPETPVVSSKVRYPVLLFVLFVAGLLLGPILIPKSVFKPAMIATRTIRASMAGGLVGFLAYCLFEFCIRRRRSGPPEKNDLRKSI